MPMRILITGGAGFIGSHLTDRLVADGHQITILDNLATGRKENLAAHLSGKSVNFIEGSILDLPLLDGLIKDTEYVFHLAAAVGVFNIVRNPIDSIKTNIEGTSNLLDIANSKSIPFFLASSSEIYGKNNLGKLNESSDRILGSPSILRWSYSEAKAIDESLTYAYWVEKKLPIRIVRLFNTVGPRQSGEFGMVIPRFVASAVSNAPITIYGDGQQMRCFTHVSDVIEGMVKIAFTPGTEGETFNIGNPTEISILQLAHKIISYSESLSEIQFTKYTNVYGNSYEDMTRRLPDIDKIVSYGWKPLKNLDFIIKELVDIAKT